MKRWLRQTDTRIFMTLALGVFLFRFGDETRAAVSPHLARAQSVFATQFDRVATSITSNITTENDTPEVVTGANPISGLQFRTGFPSGPVSTYMIVDPSCSSGSPSGCHH